MDLSLFLNSLLEFYLSFGLEYLYDNLNIISILVLSLFLFFFIFFVGIPSIPNFRKNEHTQKRHGRARRRRKGGTQEGLNYYHRKEEERELISFLKRPSFHCSGPVSCSPLGQNYDITRFRQLLCPNPSCEVCNNAAAEINQIFSKSLEVSTPSVSPVASIAPVTEPSFSQSSAIPGVPTGELVRTPLPEPSPPPPSVLPLKSRTTLGNFVSSSPPGQTLPPEPMDHPSPQPKDVFSSTLTQYDLHQGFLALRSTKISLGADPAAKFIDPRHLLFLSPDEHDSAQQHIHPKTRDNHVKQKLTQFFWGLPSLHCESLSSAVHASGDCAVFFNSISTPFTGQKSPGPPYCLTPSLPEVQPQPLPQTLPQSQHLDLTQIQPQAHIQSPLPILPSSPITQKKVCEVFSCRPKNESECLTSSETKHLESDVLPKEQESLRGLTSVVQRSKAHVAISINPVEFPLKREFREKFESHLRVRLIQYHKGQPCRTHWSLSLLEPKSNTKSGAFMPLRGNSDSLIGDKAEIESTANDLNFPLPATSLLVNKEHKPTYIQLKVSEEIHKILKAKLPVANTISGRKSQRHSLVANIQPPKMPARRAGTPHMTNNNIVSSKDRAEIGQGSNGDKSEPTFIASVSREIVRAEGFNAIQPKTISVFTTSKPGVSQGINRETTVTIENHQPSKLSVQAPDFTELGKQVMAELKAKLEKKHSQAQDEHKDMSHDSDSLTDKVSLKLAKCGPSVVMEAPQVLHVRMKKQQEPWLPKHMPRSCQDQNVPPAVQKYMMHPPPNPTEPKNEELGAGDAGLTTSQPGGKKFPPQGTALEEKFGSQSPQTQSHMGEDLPNSLFLSKVKNFLRRLQPKIKCNIQEILQEAGIPMDLAQSRGGPGKSTGALTGTIMQVHRVISNIGKFPEEKLGRQQAGNTTSPQEPLPSAAQPGKPVQKEAVQAQAEPGQGHPSHRRTPAIKNAMSSRHAAILAEKGSRHTINKDKHPQNVALKPHQNDPQSVLLKGTVPPPSPTCRPQATKGPLSVPTTAGGNAFRHQPQQFRHTMLLKNFQGEPFPTPR
ncbi:unnamed protein product [Pipistrellus nathusii]|uniref:Uncharacterized protein n=1 Tax=Pipistrellus nathusii TaxID=59473 RepID=A0ABN9Z6Q6_PIPNA